VEALVRNCLWALGLVAIALCAVFLARAAASGVESSIVIPAPRPAARMARAQTPATVYTKEIEQILKRNVFCSTCPPILPPPPSADEAAINQAPQKTSLPLALLAVMYAPSEGLLVNQSLAIIRDTEDKAMGAFAVGGVLRGAKIIDILETRVDIDNNGKPEFMELLDVTPVVATTTATPTPTTPAAPASDALAAELDRGIKKTGEHGYDIQRQTLESVLGNMNLLSRSARIVPEIRDGKAAGFRLYSVRPDGPFAKIGMQNGDVISSINGLEITSPEKALEVYAKLKSASHLSVGLERNGQKVTKDYSIR